MPRRHGGTEKNEKNEKNEKLGNWETGKLGNWETGKLGKNKETEEKIRKLRKNEKLCL
jgi:hypothetical protein